MKLLAAPGASAAPSASPSASAAQAPTAAMPPGHPQVDGMGDDEGGEGLPPGHPPTMGGASGGGGGEAMPGGMQLPRVPRDASSPDARVPAGTIEATILDENDKPLANVPVVLSVLRQSVAQGDSRSMQQGTTDAEGRVRWTGLARTSDWSYQVKVSNRGTEPNATATFAVPPFNLPNEAGWRVALHRFPVTTSLDGLIAAIEFSAASFDIREDAIEVTLEYQVVNLSPKAWSLGTGLELSLPPGFKGVRAAETMDELTVSPVEGKGVRWTGAFPPGQWTVQYDFKLPYDGEPGYDVDLELPPRVLNAAVRVAGRKGTQLRVDGFDPPRDEIATNGARFLTAVKRADPQNAIKHLSVHVSGLPEPGPEKWAAIAIGLVGLLAGIYALSRVTPESAAPLPVRENRRKQLLEELVTLEKAHRAGDVGPKAYARERARLLDAIADTLVDPDRKLAAAEPPPAKAKPARA
jgi:hypothetical protein